MVFKRMKQSKAVSNAGRYRGDLLLNRPKQALAVLALHLDADGVAELHEFGAGLAVQNRFDSALFGDAAVALGPVLIIGGTIIP